jgi:hypothetical protein
LRVVSTGAALLVLQKVLFTKHITNTEKMRHRAVLSYNGMRNICFGDDFEKKTDASLFAHTVGARKDLNFHPHA